MPETLPENNGYWSTWRDVPTARRDWWMKPGMLKHLPDRKYGGSYDPFRMNDEEPPAKGYTGTNYFRYHFYPSPDNRVYRVDYYNDRESGGGMGGGNANAFQLQPFTYEGIYSTNNYLGYGVSQPEEMFSNSWNHLDHGVRNAAGGGGMMSQYVRNTVPESYYRYANFLSWYLPLYTSYFAVRSGTTLTNLEGTGRNGSYRYTLTHTSGLIGLQANMPFTNYAGGSYFAGFRPSHTYRASAWVRSTSGNFDGVGVSFMNPSYQWKAGATYSLPQGGDWVYVYVEFKGSELYNSYYASIPNIVWGTNTNYYSGPAARQLQIEDVRVEDMTFTSPGVYELYYPDSFCAVRQDSASAGVECFQVLYDNYGVGGGGEGHPPRTFERVRDAVMGNGSKSSNYYDRSYGGQVDPRMLSRPMSAGFSYNRYMEWHPFCIWWYWILHASTGSTVGNTYYSWKDIDDYRIWEQMLPSDVDPTFPNTLPYTWHRQNNPPAYNYNYTGASQGSTAQYWRSVQFNGTPEIVDSKFEIEVSSWGYNNTSGPAGCVSNPPCPPIPPAAFYLYVVEGNGNDYVGRWPKQALTNGSVGTLLLTITPQWSGSQNGTWTLTGMDFSGAVESTYTLNTATDLGMGVNQTIYGCIPTIKPTDYPSRKVSFYLVEHWSREQTVPWFITEYDPELNRGNVSSYSSGFGTVHDTSTNYYTNSLTVGIQPLLKVQLPDKWRYAIPWGTPIEGESEPPLRMTQRNDGAGTFEGHTRITGAASETYSSVNGTRIPGLGSTYR